MKTYKEFLTEAKEHYKLTLTKADYKSFKDELDVDDKGVEKYLNDGHPKDVMATAEGGKHSFHYRDKKLAFTMAKELDGWNVKFDTIKKPFPGADS